MSNENLPPGIGVHDIPGNERPMGAPFEPVLGRFYRCLKTVKDQNLRKGTIWLYDYSSPGSDMPPMLIKDPKGGAGKGRSSFLLNGRWLLRQRGWFEPMPEGFSPHAP